VELLTRLQQLTGIELSHSTLSDLRKQPSSDLASFVFLEADVNEIRPVIKHTNVVQRYTALSALGQIPAPADAAVECVGFTAEQG
jgi:hypothetical protein